MQLSESYGGPSKDCCRSDRRPAINAIIIGASSGIGAQLAADLAAIGYSVGLAARRRELLDAVAEGLPTRALTKVMDVADLDKASSRLEELIDEMGEVDLFVISAAVGSENRDLDWSLEAETIAVNVMGFARMANAAVQHLESRGQGHLVGISSIAGIRGHRRAPAYCASKAFISNYLQALRHRFVKMRLPICVTDVQPGFVDTAMGQNERAFWVATVEKASKQIVKAIQKKKSHLYVTRRWRLIAWLIRLAPNWLFYKS